MNPNRQIKAHTSLKAYGSQVNYLTVVELRKLRTICRFWILPGLPIVKIDIVVCV